MKEKVGKLLGCLLVGSLCCHVKMLGCYPLVAVLFAAVYMENYCRSAFVAFMYLWMVLWLPIAGLFRYGIALLVWMVVLAVMQKMQVHLRRIAQSVLCGLILAAVSYGGKVMSASADWTMPAVLLPAFEGMLVAGLSFFASRLAAMALQWHPKAKQREQAVALPQQMHSYRQAMAGLAKSIETMVVPQENQYGTSGVEQMRQELKSRICLQCDRCALCFGGVSDMTLVVDALFETVEQGKAIDAQLQEKIYTQCSRAELLIQEALSIFEKAELNLSWYRRLCEHREMIAGQIDAMAYVVGDCMEQEQLCDDKERWRLLQLRYHLKDQGLHVSDLHMYQKKNGAVRLTMQLSMGWGNCITIKEVLAQINSCMSSPMISAADNRNIVGRDKARYLFITQPKMECTYGVAKMVQSSQTVSGDSFRAKRLESGRFVMALSDGMGSGMRAHGESETVVDLFMQFMEAGFAVDVALRLMNAAMIFGADAERFSTLDACLVDEYTGIVDFYKIGAHVSFIRHKSRVEVVAAGSLPMGASVEVDTIPNRSYLEAGDYLVLVTDGVLEYLQVEEPVDMLQDVIGELADTDAVTFSRKIIERILLFTGGKVADDMTVLVLKALER